MKERSTSLKTGTSVISDSTSNMQSFFILGTQPEIGQAELASVIGTPTSVLEADEVLIVDGLDANLPALHAQLGGVVKTGLIYATAKDQGELLDVIQGLITALRPGDEKIKFGLSVYPGGHRGKLTAMRTQVEKMGMRLKRELQSGGRSCRLVTSKVPVLSSVIVRKQKLLEEGIEFCLFPREHDILIGVTESVQDFEEWSARDYGRPERHAKRGMLPPKLARMMINLSEGDPATHTLLDPFCGVGTVLSEAAALGYKQVIGSDIDEAATEATRTNLAWEFERSGITLEPKIIQTKVEAIGTFLAPESVDRVVTEVFLGQPRDGQEDRALLEQRMEQLEELYAETFRALAPVLTDDARVVIAIPAYVSGQEVIEASIAKKASLFGFQVVPFTHAEATKQGALRYGRDDQHVLRDIYRFRFSR